MSTEDIKDEDDLSPEDQFANAFAELTDPNGAPMASADEPAEEPTEEPADEPAEEPAEEPTEEPADEPAEEPTEEPADEPEDKTDFAAELAKLREELKKPEPAEEPTAEPAAELPPLLTAEEQKFLDEYEKDWPDISKAESLKRRAEITEAVRYVFQQMTKTIEPIVEHYKNSEYNEHEAAIKAVHEDYDDVKKDVIDWATSQTGTRGRIFNEVVSSGTAEEIADLVSIWKEANGKTKAPVAQGAGSTNAPAEPPQKAKQAAQQLSVVSSKRTTMPVVADPNDFDSAWGEATGKL